MKIFEKLKAISAVKVLFALWLLTTSAVIYLYVVSWPLPQNTQNFKIIAQAALEASQDSLDHQERIKGLEYQIYDIQSKLRSLEVSDSSHSSSISELYQQLSDLRAAVILLSY